MTGPRALVLTALLAWLMASPAQAHGLLVKVRGQGEAVTGTVYYSDGRPGAGEWVQMFDVAQPAAAAASMNTGPDGGFRFAGVVGHRYRIVVTGEEGHSVESVITLGGQARGTFVDTDAPTADESGPSAPPAWALIGGLLALSILPALWLRRRRGSNAQPEVRGSDPG